MGCNFIKNEYIKDNYKKIILIEPHFINRWGMNPNHPLFMVFIKYCLVKKKIIY
jgi:hypothetical protein